MATDTPMTDHVMAMRKQLGEAMADAKRGDFAVRQSNNSAGSDFVLATATRAQAYFLSSIANSLIVLAAVVVEETQDAIGMSGTKPPVPPADREVG